MQKKFSIKQLDEDLRKDDALPVIPKQLVHFNVKELNNTQKSNIEIVFFNRVPKVGSQTIMELLKILSIRNNFRFNRDSVQRIETVRLSNQQQNELVHMIGNLPEPAVYIKHVCFTNFTKFHEKNPIFINIVRDPIERIISWYYYVRAPWYLVERKQSFPDLPLPETHWLRKDFETCVVSGDSECTFHNGEPIQETIGDHRRQILFFCGHHKDCTPFNSVNALAKAKHIVDTQYSVVGVLEDLNTTLHVFEKFIPRFFAGATSLFYDSTVNFNRNINKNIFKPIVSDLVKNLLRKNFTHEIEFYQFCRQRLYKQYSALNLPHL